MRNGLTTTVCTERGGEMNDGGPAFPCGSYDPTTAAEQAPVVSGMSMRDWFAGQALQGVLSSEDRAHQLEDGETIEDAKRRIQREFATWCYQMADAMIAESEEGQNTTPEGDDDATL